MRTLILLLLIAFGVAGVLYCRVNLGMSWDEMTLTLEGFIPRLMHIAVYVLGIVAFFAFVKHRDKDRW